MKTNPIIVSMESLKDGSLFQKSQHRTKKKPGPKASKARLKFYLLPNDCQLPKLTREDPIIEMHYQKGFGYPAGHYENFKGKTRSLDLNMSGEDFKQFIRGLYPVIQDRDFFLFTVDTKRNLNPAPFSLQFFKETKYQGTIIIMMKKENTSIKPEKTDSLKISSCLSESSKIHKE